jgi:peptidoglycan/xylan/chitin deacetylase (PgdA/CDA1 family)
MSASGLVKRVSVASDSVLRPPAGVTVLIYHRVGGGSDSAVDMDPSEFDRQLEHLAGHHQVIDLHSAVAGLADPSAASWDDDGPRPVVITFDDGTTDFAEHVVPALVRHGIPATLYAATRFIDEQVDFPWGAPPITWSALRDAVSTGMVHVGSHTHSHWLLDRMDTDTMAADLDRSIELIGAELGAAPTHFAYPKALPGSPASEIEVRRRFASASLAGSRVNRPGRTDLHRLWRTPVQRSDHEQFFAAKARGGMRLEGELRSLLAKVRYRGADR